MCMYTCFSLQKSLCLRQRRNPHWKYPAGTCPLPVYRRYAQHCWKYVGFMWSTITVCLGFFLSPLSFPPPSSLLPSLPIPPPFPPYSSSLPSLFLLSSLPIPPLFPPYSSSLIHTHTHTSQAVIGIEDNDLREEKLKELSTLVGVLSFPPPCYTRRQLYNIGWAHSQLVAIATHYLLNCTIRCYQWPESLVL